MNRNLLLLWSVLIFFGGPAEALAAKYEIKDLQIRPADQYASHQDFQNLTIGALACNALEETLSLFDTEKLFEKQIMPVLVVIENRNAFPVQIYEEEIYLVDPEGARHPPIPWVDVLLEINLKKPLSHTATQKNLLLQRVAKKEMILDFEHKSFANKVIAPADSDHGVVFYRLPEGGDLDGYQLFFPRILNFTEGGMLMFFEFDLQ
jgi:hypothetical protein